MASLQKILRACLCTALYSLLEACATTPPPQDINHICHVFKQYPHWYRESKEVEKRWRVPVAVQMAIIHQESKFNATAEPPRKRLLGIIPWSRPTTAHGYSQALNGTWAIYKQSAGYWFSSRESFADAVDFIGWYANNAYQRAHIARSNAYALYLAYHEGVGGYQHQTYLKKSWLLPVAHKVAARAALYQAQLEQCQRAPVGSLKPTTKKAKYQKMPYKAVASRSLKHRANIRTKK